MAKKTVALFAVSCVLLITLSLVGGVCAASSDSWSAKASMNHSRAYLGVACVDGKIYAIGGDEGSETGNCSPGTAMTNNAVNYTEEYDPSQNRWTSKTDMPTKRALFGTAVHGGKIFCIGGYNGANVFIGPESWNWKTEYYTLATNEAYDPATDTWQTLTPLPTPRYKAATNIVDGKIYVIGGYTMTDLGLTLNVNEVYDPATNSWATKTPSPLPVGSYASAVIDNKIYVLGYNQDGQRTLMIYDPAADAWAVGDKTPIGYAATAATTGPNTHKRIYYFDENRTDIYDPKTDVWSTGTPATTTNRLIAAAIALDDSIYLIGGRTGQWGYITLMYPSSIVEKYLPNEYDVPETAPTSSPIPDPTTVTPSASPAEDNPEAAQPVNQVPKVNVQFPTMQVVGALAASIFVCVGIVAWKIRKKVAA